ncbi:hypothetical protein SAMN02745866_04302 [Alteromonadaceae bacterium Bs31]|nr:hypothetical protein SAMN02745866_04302 [Alteromonadaceae bacterium Bs31]
MDMKIDSRLIIKERNVRAWSQQHLASVSGLSLRTIQRLEKSGLSSQDSLQAISSALDKEPAYFFVREEQANISVYNAKFYTLCASIIITLLGGFLFSTVSAETVGMKINYDSKSLDAGYEDKGIWESFVTVGSESKFELPNDLVLNIRAKINSDKEVELSTELRSASGELLIPYSSDSVISGTLREGVDISYEKDSQLSVVITIRELTDITKQ